MGRPHVLTARLGTIHEGIMAVNGSAATLSKLLNELLHLDNVMLLANGEVHINQTDSKSPYDIITLESISELIETINRVYRDTHGLEEDQ